MLTLNRQNLISQLQERRLSGYIVYEDDGWLWFGHVYTILRLHNCWVKVSQNWSYSEVTVIPLGWSWADSIDGQIEKFTVDIPYKQKRYGFGVFSCVEQVKSLLGIKAWWVFTPRQLKRYLDGQKAKTLQAKR